MQSLLRNFSSIFAGVIIMVFGFLAAGNFAKMGLIAKMKLETT